MAPHRIVSALLAAWAGIAAAAGGAGSAMLQISKEQNATGSGVSFSEGEDAKAQAKFAQDWRTYLSCCNECAESAKVAKVCAKNCYTMLAATAGNATGAAGKENATNAHHHSTGGCCQRFTAECLSCLAQKQVPEFCEMTDNLEVPGCVQVLQAELYEERRRNNKAEES
jgi:hypothetical protein